MPQKSQGFCVQGKSTQRALSIISCHGVQNLFCGVHGCNKIGFIGFTGGMHIETACCIFARWQHIRQIVLPTEICLRGDVASGRTIMARQRRPECKQRGIMTFTHHSPSFRPLRSPSTSKTFPIGVRGVTYRLLFTRCNLDFNLSSRSSISGLKASSKVYLI